MLMKKFLVLLFTTLCFVSSAFAASKSRELSIDGNYISVGGQSASLLNASIGNFVTPQFLVVSSLTSQQNFGISATSISLGGKFYFMDGFKGDLVPFANAGIGLRLMATPTDSNHGSTQYEAGVGVAYFLSDSTTLDARIRVMNFNDGSSPVTLISAGFSQRF